MSFVCITTFNCQNDFFMCEVPNIDGADLVVDRFGYWPSFHDAEVISLTLDRQGPKLVFLIHAWEMTDEVDDNGYFRKKKHSRVRFICDQIDEMSLDGFNHQNVLFEIAIKKLREEEKDQESWGVVLDPSFGLTAEIKCRSMRIESVVACDSEGNLVGS